MYLRVLGAILSASTWLEVLGAMPPRERPAHLSAAAAVHASVLRPHRRHARVSRGPGLPAVPAEDVVNTEFLLIEI